jgi:phosphoribosylaminoimidazole-succinocarboxamide synthase
MPTADPRTVTETNLPDLPVRRGKVRDIYDLGEELLLVASDRISAYDVVLPTPIPGKGELLTRMSKFWFDQFADRVPHHLIELIDGTAPPGLEAHLDVLRGRAMRCRKAEVVPVECVVRGYLAGSGWVEYQQQRTVCNVSLPEGLQLCDQLPRPIFTPATKATSGHDENIAFERACEIAGTQTMTMLRERSLTIYEMAAAHARERGIIIADTKFEWGRIGDEYILVDEVLTPDSSRFWPADAYEPGRDQTSFDKQYVRNYLTGLCEQGKWDKTPPGPVLPDEIVRNTAAKYREAFDRLIS